MADRGKLVEEGVQAGVGLIRGLFGKKGVRTGAKGAADKATELLRGASPEEIKAASRLPRDVSGFSAPGTPLVSAQDVARRQAIETLLQNPRGRRTLASVTGEFPDLPAGTTPTFRDLRTQSLLARGKSLEPRTLGDIAQGAKEFAAARPKISLLLGGLGGLTGVSLTAGALRGGAAENQLPEADILNIISKSGVGQSSEDYLKSLAKQQVAGLGTTTALPADIQRELDAQQVQYENAIIDANRRYLEAIGAGADVPAASMAAYGQGAQAAQAAAEADTGTAVSGLVPVSGELAAAPEMLREEGARQAALEQILASTAAGSDQRLRELAALAGAESVANLRTNYEAVLRAQKIQDYRDRKAAEQAIQQDLFGALADLSKQRVKAGEGLRTENYVDKVNEYVNEYNALSDTQKALLAQQNGVANASDYATARLRQDYGV